jgi:DNA-binding response OmpR family regulator
MSALSGYRPSSHQFDLNTADNLNYREVGISRFLILLIDDDPQIQSLLVRYLDRERYKVLCAPGADEALSLLDIFSPTFILLDLHLSKVQNADGIALLQELRDTDYKNPIYILSGDTSFDKTDLAVKNGANGYLIKNFTEPFWNRLNTILNYYNLGTQPRRYSHLSVAAVAYLETSGLSERDLQLLNEFSQEYAREKELSRGLERSLIAIRKEFQRIRDRQSSRPRADDGGFRVFSGVN